MFRYNPDMDSSLSKRRRWPIGYFVAPAFPIVGIVVGWMFGWLSGHGDFQTVSASQFAIVGGSVGTVIGFTFGVLGYFRGELRTR